MKKNMMRMKKKSYEVLHIQEHGNRKKKKKREKKRRETLNPGIFLSGLISSRMGSLTMYQLHYPAVVYLV